MSACEKCWADAYMIALNDRTVDQGEAYHNLVLSRTTHGPACTPREQAGQFWDEEKQRDSREERAK